VCNEHGIRGGGEYCGDDNDAQLECINVFYYEAGRNLVNHTRKQNWPQATAKGLTPIRLTPHYKRGEHKLFSTPPVPRPVV
jgi:hypothetical protein